MSHSEILNAYETDETLKKLKSLVEFGFPESKKCLENDLKPFWNFRNNLITKDSMLYYGDRIVAPVLLRSKILKVLHGAHQGSRSMELRAGKLWFWPGMASDIQGFKNNCLSCNECQPSNSDLPPQKIVEPVYPFQDICIDYCSYAGHKYGVMVDRFSGWPCVWKAKDITFADWLEQFCQMCGIPETVSTDGGPEFQNSEVQKRLKQYGIHHRISLAYNPHSNSRAEIGVKTVKRMMRQNIDSDGSILNSRFLK